MSSTPSQLQLSHPSLQGVSDGVRTDLERRTRLLRFEPGQTLCDSNIVPNQILLVLQGEARLINDRAGQISTLAKLGSGQWIGLASLLRAAPCEAVIASSEILVASIPDDLILELIQKEKVFSEWCSGNVFAAEVAGLAEVLLGQSTRSDIDLQSTLVAAYEKCRVLTGTVESLESSRKEGMLVFVGSANAKGVRLGEEISFEDPLPKVRPPLQLRLLSLPAKLVDEIRVRPSRKQVDNQGEPEPTRENSIHRVVQAVGSLPARSGLDLGTGASEHLKSLKLSRGEGPVDGTLACLQMMARVMKLPYRRDSIERTLQESVRRGRKPSLQLCGQLAANLGLHVVGMSVACDQATRLQTPAMIPWNDSFALILESNALGLRLATPDKGWVFISPEEVLSELGETLQVLLLDRNENTPGQKFGWSWFLPALKRHRGSLIQVLVASFVVQMFSLANPLLIQVIIDKVISQRSLDTLQVLGIALVVVALLEAILGSLRTFLFAETTNRIDLRLGADVIDHLLRLPLGYFDRRPVGELGTRVAELEKIRNFLTGQALTTILDAAFSLIYIVVMAVYSWVLTFVALAVLPIQIGIAVIGAPLFRRQFRKAAEENARTQSHLVEVLTGIQTVKAQNVEMVSRWTWQDLYSRYIGKTFERTITGTAINESSQFLQKLSQLLVLWIGAGMVLEGTLSLGQLIAFRIISGYVTQPLLRLSNIWQSIQELRVSFDRLSDVVDTPEESNEVDQTKTPLPPISGSVSFEDVCFSFAGEGGKNALQHVDLRISPGTFVGVVGLSGSGKSTLMKLLPRLYSPQRGRILIDGIDISKVELYSLRRQIGIVPQEPLLFSGSVANNIALTDPEATNEAIIDAAKIAEADEFIMKLQDGYSTEVGERGSALSGGQRQRIAIARTILSNPTLLVLDEATSALDYATERKVCDNLVNSLSGRTVFFITHRLNTIRRANLIVMMDQGGIVESGSHDELMSMKGKYFALYRQQEGVE